MDHFEALSTVSPPDDVVDAPNASADVSKALAEFFADEETSVAAEAPAATPLRVHGARVLVDVSPAGQGTRDPAVLGRLVSHVLAFGLAVRELRLTRGTLVLDVYVPENETLETVHLAAEVLREELEDILTRLTA